MDSSERAMINDLFDRLREAAAQASSRDPAAERLISERMAAQPDAAYVMAQTILVQEQALKEARARIDDLERGPAPAADGGFLSGFLGGMAPNRSRANRAAAASPFRDVPRGGFLAGAAQTALGVTGGVLLGGAIASMFSDGEAGADGMDQMADGGDADFGDFGDLGGGEFL
ncbi:DUF2076 domain-containing protein [Rhodospira trueperi]|uniref:DUF2076 domain-containing protein n=1 Tax=Rhodospira trueperi TaxID=69960 RepID=A0A1G7F073_9PROT|nr:DUF2076 family protein [Rhodospira trueperi]SDE68955.1 hypothetical protein SAMN05421720_11045 [Rhodospira trueperi]